MLFADISVGLVLLMLKNWRVLAAAVAVVSWQVPIVLAGGSTVAVSTSRAGGGGVLAGVGAVVVGG